MDILRIGHPEEFALIRVALTQANYIEQAICERLEAPTITHARSPARQLKALEQHDALDICIRLFLDGAYVSTAAAGQFLTPIVLDTMIALDLVRLNPRNPAQCASPVMLYPTRGVYIASDRETNPDMSPHELPGDTVYPAIGKNTQRFLSLLPETPAADFLELCGGTGAAAIIAASRNAARASTYDITARSTHFAEFNRLLNGLQNVIAACGNLYDPAGGATFDYIAAHPPYVPSTGEGLIFKEGGDDGEFVTRAIIEGLPRYLRRGGQFHCLCAGTDREEGRYEDRIRRWLGEAEDEFDIILASEGEVTLKKVKRWDELVARYKITGLFYGSIVIQRRVSKRRPFTLRRIREEGAGYEGTAWLFQAAGLLHSMAADEVMELRPRVSEQLEFQVHHKWMEGEFRATALELRIRSPFLRHVEAEPWIIRFIEACDGNRTCAQITERLRSSEIIGEEPIELIAGMVCTMIMEGHLTINSLPAAG
jgi:SAM-dependent methyltransferase